MQTLNIGADTFVGGLISGFNSALSIVQSVVAVMQAMKTINSILGFIPGLATGGSVPGIGDTDSVPAMLTPGEYVVKKSVVNKFGSGFFEWITRPRPLFNHANSFSGTVC